MSRAALVLNPVKTTDADGLLEVLRRRCRALGWAEASVHETTAEAPGGAATRAAREASATSCSLELVASWTDRVIWAGPHPASR